MVEDDKIEWLPISIQWHSLPWPVKVRRMVSPSPWVSSRLLGVYLSKPPLQQHCVSVWHKDGWWVTGNSKKEINAYSNKQSTIIPIICRFKAVNKIPNSGIIELASLKKSCLKCKQAWSFCPILQIIRNTDIRWIWTQWLWCLGIFQSLHR